MELEEVMHAYFVLSYSNHEHSAPLGVLPFVSFPVVAIQVVHTDRGGYRFGGTQEMRGRGQENRRRGGRKEEKEEREGDRRKKKRGERR